MQKADLELNSWSAWAWWTRFIHFKNVIFAAPIAYLVHREGQQNMMWKIWKLHKHKPSSSQSWPHKQTDAQHWMYETHENTSYILEHSLTGM